MAVKERRENAHRAVFLNDTIDQELFKRIAPEIVRLRLESSDPICLFIDSLGGSTFYAERILDLIKSPTQDGHRCKITSVAIGFAASAAADLLALGDYSIAYPEAFILCHGSRQSKKDITLEDVHSLADSLRETNENFAMRLASRMFRRLVFHMVMLNSVKQGETYMPFYNSTSDPKSFLDKLKSKVSESKKAIFETANARQQKIAELVNAVGHRASTETQTIEVEAKLLKDIIDFEAVRLGKNSKNLSRADLNVIQDDFIQLNDFFYGRYRHNLKEIVCEQGHIFLSESEESEFNLIDSSEATLRQNYLLDKVAPRLNPLWYFVVSICRELQHGEHPISPTDAFWLGLVDEVAGSSILPSMREIDEAVEKNKAVADSLAKETIPTA